jgi:hypothetical protein
MAQELSQLFAGNITATIEARLQRILSITASFYGLVPVHGVGLHAGGSRT